VLLADPEARLQHGLDVAYAALAKRDRTEREVRDHLTAKRVEPDTIEAVLAELREQGYVDDARYATRFAEDRRSLDGWGPDRIERRLLAVGVAPDVIAGALASRELGDELSAAVDVLRRRFPAPPAEPRDLQRALGFLVRKGYDVELAHDALRSYSRDAA
jgi:regulatory protein